MSSPMNFIDLQYFWFIVWTLNIFGPLLSIEDDEALGFNLKYLIIFVLKINEGPRGIATTWGCENNRIFIFGWSNYLNTHMHAQTHTKWIVTVISEAWWQGRKILLHIAGSCRNISIHLSSLVDPHYKSSVYVIICQSDGNWHPWLLTLGTVLCARVHLYIVASKGWSRMFAHQRAYFYMLRFASVCIWEWVCTCRHVSSCSCACVIKMVSVLAVHREWDSQI